MEIPTHQQLILRDLPEGSVILKHEGDYVEYGQKIKSELGAKVTRIALFVFMCMIPILWLMDDMKARYNGLKKGVEKIEHYSQEKARTFRLFREVLLSDRGSKDVKLVAANGNILAHSEFVKKFFPAATSHTTTRHNCELVHLQVFLHYAYLGMETSLKQFKTSDDKVLCAVGILVSALTLDQPAVVDEAIAALQEGDLIQKASLTTLNEIHSWFTTHPKMHATEYRDKLTALTTQIHNLMTGY